MANSQPATTTGLHSSRRSFRRILHPDMTPMVGLGFLLVTFFLLAADFTKTTVLQLSMPVKLEVDDVFEGTLCNLSDVITVILGKNGKVHYYEGLFAADIKPFLNTTDLSATGLRQVLLKQKAKSRRLLVLIKPSDEAKYRDIVDALDEMDITDQYRYALVDITAAEEKYVQQQGL
jgi:biopolymer transport protein ExbD